MLEKVDNYKEVKSFLEGMGEVIPTTLNPRVLLRLKGILKEYFLPEVYRDFVTVIGKPRLIEVDNILNDYFRGKISLNKVRTSLTETEQTTYSKQIADATKARNDISCNKRDAKCIWITGASATGKTTLASLLAHEHYEEDDILRADGGANMFDAYNLQPVFIIEEMKGDKMKFSTYLLLTDNNTNVNMPARYHNVNFKNLKELYMTSTNLPSETYACMQESEGEDIYQAYRRLGFHYYEIVRDGRRGPTGIVYDVKLDPEGPDPTVILEKIPVYNVKYPKGGEPIFTPYQPF